MAGWHKKGGALMQAAVLMQWGCGKRWGAAEGVQS